LDQVSRADLKVGEETMFSDFGEFRHYLSEKAVYNKVNRGAGKEMVDVSPSVFRFGGVGDAIYDFLNFCCFPFCFSGPCACLQN
jgi:hypothetical protein